MEKQNLVAIWEGIYAISKAKTQEMTDWKNRILKAKLLEDE